MLEWLFPIKDLVCVLLVYLFLLFRSLCNPGWRFVHFIIVFKVLPLLFINFIRGQLAGVSDLLLPHGFRERDSGCQASFTLLAPDAVYLVTYLSLLFIFPTLFYYFPVVVSWMLSSFCHFLWVITSGHWFSPESNLIIFSALLQASLLFLLLYISIYFCAVLGIEPRSLHLLGKDSISELCPSPHRF